MSEFFYYDKMYLLINFFGRYGGHKRIIIKVFEESTDNNEEEKESDKDRV